MNDLNLLLKMFVIVRVCITAGRRSRVTVFGPFETRELASAALPELTKDEQVGIDFDSALVYTIEEVKQPIN